MGELGGGVKLDVGDGSAASQSVWFGSGALVSTGDVREDAAVVAAALAVTATAAVVVVSEVGASAEVRGSAEPTVEGLATAVGTDWTA